MTNFSELLDTNPQIKIKICLSAITDNGCPCCKLTVNGSTRYDGMLTGPVALEFLVGLMDPIGIEIMMSGKNYSAEKETAIVLDAIAIDSFEIVPEWTHLAKYENERGIDSPTSYLGFNGVWRVDINEPFYRWRHRVTSQGWLLEPVKA